MLTVKIGDCVLYHGDARKLKPMGCDLALFDAPYLLTSGGKSSEFSGKLSKENYVNSGSIVQCDITWPEIFTVISKGLEKSEKSHIYCMVNNRNIKDAWIAAEDEGFYFHNILPWNKIIATANRWYMKNNEFTLMFKKGPAFPINDCGQMQTIKFPPPKGGAHPTEKPVELMANYIRQSSKRGQIVFDPFMGSGSTLVAAVREGRKAIGCEIDKEYFDIACKRVAAEYENQQKGLF